MADVEKKYDFLAALAKNPELGISDLKKLGVTPENSAFKTKSEYENTPGVIELFRNENGEFDKNAFSQFYDNALIAYNNYSINEYVPKATELFGYLDSEWDRPKGSKVMKTTPTFTIGDHSTNSYGMYYINKYGTGFMDQSVREIAEQNEVVDYETGLGLGWTPEDKGGLFKGLVRPAIVVASWDEEGDHEENGQIVHHLKGDLKFRNGKPYAETLGNRSLAGKQQITYGDTLTREGSWLNKYDFFDSDGLDKNIVGTIAKTAFMTLPYLIPGVGEVLGAVTAFTALNRVLPELGKAINGIAGQDPNNEFSKSMNQWAGWFSKFDPSVSDYSQEHLLSWENLGNLISSVSGQLFQQRVVGAIPLLFKNSESIVNQAKWGRNLAYGYMGLTSSQGVYDTFKEAGANDTVAGWAFVANMLALSGLMMTDYGKGLLFKGSWLDENVIRKPSMDAAKEVLGNLTEGIENVTPKERAKIIQKLTKFYRNNFSSAAEDTFFNRGLSESLEEMIEEGTQDLLKVITSTLQSLGVNTGDKELDFGWSTTDMLQRYGMAAAGGFIGGGIFHLQGKWDKFLSNDLVQHTDEDSLQKLAYYIGQGRAQEIRDYYGKWHKKGLLGSTTLGTNLSTIEGIDGTQTVAEPSNGKLSQNDVVYNTLIKYVDTIEDTIRSEGLKIDIGTMTRAAVNGYKESDSALKADTLINLGIHDLLIKDVYDLAGKIVKKKAELQSEINNLTIKEDTPDARRQTEENIKNSDLVKSLEKDLDALRKKRDSILSGENNWRYGLQAIFASNPRLASKFIDLSIENYTKVKHHKIYETLTEAEQNAIKEEYEEYMSNEGKNQLLRAADVYLGISQRFAERLKQEQDSLKGHSADDLHNVATDFQENFVVALRDFSSTVNELSALTAKADKTEEDVNRESELKTKLSDLEKKLTLLQTQPYNALVHHSDKYKSILDRLSAQSLTPEEEDGLFNDIKKMYEDYRANKKQLNGDGEYNAAINKVKSEFQSAADINQRLASWYRSIIDQEAITSPEDPEGSMAWQSFVDETFGSDDIFDGSDFDNLDTPFLNRIKELSKNFIDNLGVDNSAANEIYQQIVSELEVSKLPAKYKKSLLEAIIPEIYYNGKPTLITDYISEIDTIRKDVKYSAFEDLLQDFAVDLYGTRLTLLDLIKEQRGKLSGVANLTDYLIRNESVKKELENAENLIKVVQGVIMGSVDKTNSSVNAFKGNPITLAELDENTGNILWRQSHSLINEINSLKDLAHLNGLKLLRVHEDIDKHMRTLYLNTLINNKAFVDAFKEKFYIEDADGNKTGIDIAEIANAFKPASLDLSTPETNNPKELFEFETKFRTELYHRVQQSTIWKDTKTSAKTLVELFGNSVWKMETSTLKTDTVEITQYSLLSYLQVLLSVPSEDFYTKFGEITQSPDSEYAPIYSQELGLQYIAALACRPDLSNAILDELKLQADSYADTLTEEEDKTWIKNLSTIKNFISILGGAGVGKSSMIAHNTAKIFENTDHEYICIAPKTSQAENLSKFVGESVRFYDKDTFLKETFGTNFAAYSFNENIGHWRSEEIPIYNDNVFDRSKKVKILFIDEVSLFTESELQHLSDYAQRNGILIVGLGDDTQNSAKVFSGKYISKDGSSTTKKESWHSTGLEDCLYFSAPFLTASLRNSNLAKFENFNVFSKILDDIRMKWRGKRELSFQELDAFVPSNLEINYFEKDNIIYGEKIVADDTDLKELANKYKDKGRTVIITDDLNKYQGLRDIEIKSYHEMQGGEWDYVLVDVDFRKNNTIGGRFSKYSALRDLYTLSQRSKTVSIIKDRGIKAELSITNKNLPELNQASALSKEDISVFKNRRGQILDGVATSNNLYDYLYDFTKLPSTITDPPVTDSSTDSSTPEDISTVDDSSGTPPVATPPSTPPPGAPSTLPPSTPPALPPGTPSTTGSPAPAVGTSSSSNGSTRVPANITQSKSSRSLVHNATKTGSSIINDGEYKRFLYDPVFNTTEKDNTYSLINWKDKNFKDVIITQKHYRDLISHLASSIMTEIPIEIRLDNLLNAIAQDSNNLDKESARNMVSTLKGIFLKKVPDIYIVEYNNEVKKIVARYTTDNSYIEIPVGFTRTALVGEYEGGFKRNRNLRINPNDQKWRSLEEFSLEFPGVYICEDWGIVSDTVSGFSPNTDRYLKANKGKVGIVATDQPMYAAAYFPNWHEREQVGENVYAISHYYDLVHAMIQKPADPVKILQFVNSLHNKDADKRTIQNIANKGLWESPNAILGELTGNQLSDLPTGEQYYKTINGRAWQVLPRDRADLFISIALKVLKGTNDYNKLVDKIGQFMHTIVLGNERILGERHAVLMSDGTKSYWVQTVVTNNHIVGYKATDYYNGTFGTKTTFFNAERKFPFDKIKQHFFGGNPDVTLSFKRAIINTDNIPSYQNVTPNDSIYIVFGNAGIDLDNFRLKMLSSDQFINGIYVNDAAGDRFSPTSAFRIFTGGKDGYYIKGGIEYSLWSIDETKIKSNRSNPSSNPNSMDAKVQQLKQKLDSIKDILPKEHQTAFSKNYDWATRELINGTDEKTIIDRLISSINEEMAFTYNDWHGKEIVYENGNYILRSVDNMELWIDRTVRRLLANPSFGIDPSTITEIGLDINGLDAKWAIVSVNISGEERVFTLALDSTNNWNLLSMSNNTYEAFKIMETMASLYISSMSKEDYNIINSFLDSLRFVWENSTKVDSVKATKILESYPDLKLAVNRYLEERIKNNEC